MLWSAGLPPPQADLLSRLPDREGAEDLEVDHDDQDRSERDRRRAGRRSAALLRAARVHARRRRRLHLRGAVPALRVRPRQRPRQPAEPHDLDGAQVRRREAADGVAHVTRTQHRRSPRSREQARTAWEAFAPVAARSRRPGRSFATANATSTTQKPWALREDRPKTGPTLHGVLGRLLRDAALGGADGRARDAQRRRGDPAPAGTRSRTKDVARQVGLAGRHA